MKEHYTFVCPRLVAGILRFWFNIALAAVLLWAWGSAQAQYNPPTPKAGGTSVVNYGTDQTYTISLGATVAGTLWDVTYAVTNNTAYPLHFTRTAAMTLSGLTLVSGNPPSDITLASGQSFAISFQAGVPFGGTAVANAQPIVTYSVERVYDRVWHDDDFDEGCALLNTPSLLYASGSGASSGGNDLNFIIPGCVFGADMAFYNDLSVPVKISYADFSADGAIAPFIFGTLCGINGAGNSSFHDGTVACDASENWPSGGIVLQPGKTSPLFGVMVGIPWFVGNASRNVSGNYTFQWDITPLLGASQPPAPAPVPALGAWALALLTLALMSVGMWRAVSKR
ncbi:MAG: hypothetical protein FWF41_02975 [Betaproteobacteria bacterium]|nr:hypothetical protein [Betaproteobacteria bacterium]